MKEQQQVIQKPFANFTDEKITEEEARVGFTP
jgi:hypothetical protein